MQRASGVPGGDGEFFDQQHVAGVQTRIHLHDGDTRLRVTGFNGAMNRCRAAPARQQRSVDIQTTEPGSVEHPLRQDQSVSGDHHRIGVCRFNRLARSGGFFRVFAIQAQAARLRHGDVVRFGPLLDSRGVQLQAATGRAVGLSEYQRDVKTGGMQLSQRHLGKFWSTSKNKTHGTDSKESSRRQAVRLPSVSPARAVHAGVQARSSSFFCLSSLLLMRLRLRGERYSTNTLPSK